MKNKVLLINVLSSDYYNECHIKGSINVEIDKLKDYAKDLSKDQLIVVHCFSYNCHLSDRAFNMLKELGFNNIKEYKGGIALWVQLGYPTEGSCKDPYLQVKALPLNKTENEISAQELKKLLYD
jgi:rhodanese-related sulfurtransferase